MWLATGFVVLWMMFFTVDYLWHHLYYSHAVQSFPYFLTAVLIFAIVAGVGWVHREHRDGFGRWTWKRWNGLTWWGLLLVIEVAMFEAFVNETNSLTTGWSTHIPHLLGQLVSAHLFLGGVSLLAMLYGRYVMGALRLQFAGPVQALVQMGAGFGIMAIILFAMAALGLLQGWWPWIVLIVLALPQVKILPRLGKELFLSRAGGVQTSPWIIVPVAAGLVLVAANLLGMNRPVVIGFDAINFYVNIPRLLAAEGQLVTGGQPYNWSLLMALGFSGWESTRFVLLLSLLPGVWSIFIVYHISRLYLPVSWSALAAVVWYALPMVTWQSTQEAKVDLALLMIVLTAIVVLLAPATHTPSRLWPGKERAKLTLIGFLLGIAVGIKFTALFAIMGVAVAWAYQRQGIKGGVVTALLSVAALFLLGLYRFSPLPLHLVGSLIVGGIFLLTAVGIWMFDRQIRQHTIPVLKQLGFLSAVMLLTFSPWFVKNGIETKSVALKTLITGQPLYPELPPLQQLKPAFDDPEASSIYWLGQTLYAQQGTLDISRISQEALRGQKGMSSGEYEEIARYMGYEPTVPQLLTLPYDITMRTNVNNYVVDSGLWLFVLLPLLLFGSLRKRWWTVGAIGLLWLFAAISIYGGWHALGLADPSAIRAVLEQGSIEIVVFGLFQPLNEGLAALGKILFDAIAPIPLVYGIVCSLLILLGVLIFAYQQRAWAKAAFGGPILFAITYFTTWWLMGSGIPWYGIAGFAMAPVILLVWVYAHFRSRYWVGYIGLVFLGGALLLHTTQRWYSPHPLASDKPALMEEIFATYTAGEKTTEAVTEVFTGKYTPVVKEINATREGKILRFGTYINYYINRNTERVILDNQLNNFKYLYDYVDGDWDKLHSLMRYLDIRYIIMSLKVGDDTKEQLLAQKAQLVMDFMRHLLAKPTPAARMMYTDQNKAKGEAGTYVAFEIL